MSTFGELFHWFDVIGRCYDLEAIHSLISVESRIYDSFKIQEKKKIKGKFLRELIKEFDEQLCH
jgi:hypothetical protein